ncbi:hypothetical protein N665_0195s0019 [Sinapis alba]|nr:hypothetical protein N665_0195s0019 [Sinapis alba]
MDPCCQACGFEGESVNHIVFDCSVARQVWALAEVPTPMNGFDKVSHFSNFHYVMMLGRNKKVSEKTRNGLIFEGKAFVARDVIGKIGEEADFWLMAQKFEKDKEEEERRNKELVHRSWEPPRKGWLKCNIRINFDKDRARSGGAWVINELGKVIMHSRRAFSNIHSLDEAKFQGLLWALDCLSFHHLNRVIVAIDDSTLTEVMLRPKAWPNFRTQYMEMERRLRRMEWWRLVKEVRSTNRGACLIAQSVVKGGFAQSYVASGAPQWLQGLFESEEVHPFL